MNPYIFPTTKVHSSFAAASDFYDKYAALQFFEEKRVPKLSDLAQGKASEMQPVLAVYRNRRSDLWRHLPSSFVDAVEQYHVAEAAPILKEFVTEPAFDSFVRCRALTVVDSIAPDPAFLEDIFERYKTVSDENEQSLAELANGLLITSHANTTAIRWRLKEVTERVAAFSPPSGRVRIARAVGDLESEMTFGNPRRHA